VAQPSAERMNRLFNLQGQEKEVVFQINTI